MKLPAPSRTRLLYVSLGMNACFLVALLAWATTGGLPTGGPPMLDPERRTRAMRREFLSLFEPLEPTDAQRAALRAQLDGEAEILSRQFGNAQAARMEALARIAEAPEDDAVFQAALDGAVAEHLETATMMQQGMRDAALVLTPEQRTKLAKAIRERIPPAE